MLGMLRRQRDVKAVLGTLACAAGFVLVGAATTAYAHPIEYHTAAGSALRFPFPFQAGLGFDPYGTKAVQGAAAGPTSVAEVELGAAAETPVSTLGGSSRNVELVSKLRLTNSSSTIADVSYHDGFAYLSAWAGECARSGAGGVHIVDVRDPANPQKR